jgi:hypothetical protein
MIGALAVAGLLASVDAARADDNIGCGLGTQLFEGKDDTLFQILGATTNGILGNQTFGISSNTLGCKRNQVITAEARRSLFASANLDRLARDMASGEGETLTALAEIMQIEDSDRAAFGRLTKDHFVALFPSDQVTAGDMLGTLDRLMAEDADLSRYAAL